MTPPGKTSTASRSHTSEKTAELIDSEAKKIVEESYLKAKEVISANIVGLKQLAEQLLEKEVIFSEDLERIFGKRKGEKPAEAAAPAEVSAPAETENAETGAAAAGEETQPAAAAEVADSSPAASGSEPSVTDDGK